MKKVFLILSAALMIFAGCNEKEPVADPDKDNQQNQDQTDDGKDENEDQNDEDTPAGDTFVLTDQMVVVGVDGDWLVVVDDAMKLVLIEVPYEAKDKLAALPVSFENLPEGVTAEAVTLNLANEATAPVVFKKGETEFTYTFSASYAQPDPRFTGIKLIYKGNPEDTADDQSADVAGDVAKFKSGTDLKELVVEYTVAPEGTKVYVGSTEIISGTSVVDFSDKVGGVNFELKLEEVSKTVNIKAMTTGISQIYRKWSKYSSDAGDWFAELTEDGVKDMGWERNIAMDDKYLYLVRADEVGKGGKGGIYAFNIADGTLAKSLNVEGLNKNGNGEEISAHWLTTDAEVVDNGGSPILLVCNGAISDGHTLQVFKYTSIDAAPELVLSYKVVGNDIRLGDKFQVYGDWTKGRLAFTNYKARNVYFFDIANGVVNQTPTVTALPGGATGSSVCGLYKFSDTEYMWSGTGAGSNKPVVFSYASGAFTVAFDASTISPDPYYGGQNHDAQFFTFNEQKYMAVTRRSGDNFLGTLRVFELNGETLAASIENPGKISELSIAHPTDVKYSGIKDANATGACAVCHKDGKTYIASCVLGSGVSVFELQ